MYTEHCSLKQTEFHVYFIPHHSLLVDHLTFLPSKLNLQLDLTQLCSLIYLINCLMFTTLSYEFAFIYNYRSQLIITAVLVSVQFMATLVWVFAAFPDAKLFYPQRNEVSNNDFLLNKGRFLHVAKLTILCPN